METRAKVSGVRGSARKARLVADQIRGKGVEDALALLQLSHKRAARPMHKLLKSARRERGAEERAREGGHRRRQPGRPHRARRRRPEPVADHAARAGPRLLGPEALAPRHRGAGGALGEQHGTEGPSVRIPARHPLRVAVELVRRAPLRGAAPRGREDPPLHQEEALPRGHLEGRDRAHRREGRGQHPHRAPGHPDRQARRRGRRAPQGSQRAHHRRGLHQHQGDPQGGARRPARRRERRDAARAPRRVPPRDEEGRHPDDEVRRRRHPHPVLGPPRRRRDGSPRVVPRGPRAAAHAARRHRVRLRRGQHDLRRDRREVLDLQGRRRRPRAQEGHARRPRSPGKRRARPCCSRRRSSTASR